MFTPSTPGAPFVGGHVNHALHITSLRASLSKERVEPTCSVLLGAAIQHALKSSNGIRAIGLPDGPSRHSGTHQRSSLRHRAPMKQGSFAQGRVMLSCPSSLVRPLRLPLGHLTFPGVTGYSQTCSRPPQGRGRVGPLQFPRQPSDRSTSPTPGGPSPVRSKDPKTASMAFAKSTQARHPTFPSHPGSLSRRCRLRFMLRPASLLHPASTPVSQPDPGASLPGTLASPRTGTRTGWLTRASRSATS